MKVDADNDCILLYADERVRLIGVGNDGAIAQVILKRNRQQMWIALSELKYQSEAWINAPWISVPWQQEAEKVPPVPAR